MILNPILMAAALLLIATLSQASAGETMVTLRTESASFGIDGRGSLCLISRNSDGRSYLAAGQPAPLLSLCIDGKLTAPDKAEWTPGLKSLTLHYGQFGPLAEIHVETRPTHVVFELREFKFTQGMGLLDYVLWGPYPTTIGDIIGETVGVVRDKEFAIGLQALNTKTLGGYPTHESDIEPDYTADDAGNYPDLPPELKKAQGFRGRYGAANGVWQRVAGLLPHAWRARHLELGS